MSLKAYEAQALLTENAERHRGPAYRDHPELENPSQHPNSNMGLSHQINSESADDLPSPAMRIIKPEGRKWDLLGLGLILAGCTLLVVITWFAILSNNPASLGLFAFHPPLQTLAVSLFAYGILTLQPTSQPHSKVAGLNRHQLIILGLGFPCISVGTLVIIWNKNVHDAPHFVTWHGTFGILCIVWMFIQMFLGAGSVWGSGKLFGGGMKAKSVWKYHRLSGYLLYPFFLLTIAIGGGWSNWTTSYLSLVTRVFAYCVAPLAILVGLWSRARLSKMKFF